MKGTIALITGGSKGIGKATAKEIVRLGGSVCIIARNKKAIQQASDEIAALINDKTQFVDSISADTTKMNTLKPLIAKFVKKRGIPDYLINCVGYAYPGYINQYSFQDFKENMEINYYGQLVPILILLPYFMKERKGYIANCSSVGGFMGIMGYATYTPSKYAILGLTECLRHELKPYNVGCSVLFPPDTDTPGLETENKTKPVELSIISAGGGLLQPEAVAKKFVKGIQKKRFYILPGQAGLIWRVSRHFPRLFHLIMDSEYNKAKKKMKKKKK